MEINVNDAFTMVSLEMIITAINIVLCHILGNSYFKNEYATDDTNEAFTKPAKGSSEWHHFIRCLMYILPFYLCFGPGWQLIILFITHIVINPTKAKWDRISYLQDQVLHYVIAFLLYFARVSII